MSIKIKFDDADVLAAKVALLGVKDGIIRASVRAINSALRGARTDIKKILRVDYNLKASSVDKRIKIHTANFRDTRAWLISTGKPLSLAEDVAGTKQTPAGVSLNVKKSTGRKTLPGFFINKAKSSGKLIVLSRPKNPATGKKYSKYGPAGSGGSRKGKTGPRATLDVRYGPHPETLINAKESWEQLSGLAQKRLDKAFEKEINAILKGYAK